MIQGTTVKYATYNYGGSATNSYEAVVLETKETSKGLKAKIQPTIIFIKDNYPLYESQGLKWASDSKPRWILVKKLSVK
tara:strand:+ start:264 stop:500 length:237 start_codon:yes stop_codon:yes gene_type:complete